jgi:hypothetical protein
MSNIPDLSKIYIRAPNKLIMPAINKVSLRFFSFLFVLEKTGIISNSAKPRKTVIAIASTQHIDF